MLRWTLLAVAAASTYAFAPASVPTARSPTGLRMACDNSGSLEMASRRSFLRLGGAAVGVFGLSHAVGAEDKILVMPDELSAPSEEEDKERVKKEFAKIKANENKDNRPRWQIDLEKQKQKKAQAKKDVKNRDELCEVLGRGC